MPSLSAFLATLEKVFQTADYPYSPYEDQVLTLAFILVRGSQPASQIYLQLDTGGLWGLTPQSSSSSEMEISIVPPSLLSRMIPLSKRENQHEQEGKSAAEVVDLPVLKIQMRELVEQAYQQKFGKG